MKNKILLITLVLFLVVSLTACNLFKPYDPDDFIGITSAEIMEKHGEFDHRHAPAGDDGLYHNTKCGYIVREAQVGFLGTDPPKYFMICFDANGVAYECAYETGGCGG